MAEMGGQFGQQAAPIQAAHGKRPAPPAGTAQNPMTVQVQTPPPTAFYLVESVLAEVLSPLGTVLLVFIVAVFMLLQKEDLRDRLIRLVGSTDLHRTTLAMNDAGGPAVEIFSHPAGDQCRLRGDRRHRAVPDRRTKPGVVGACRDAGQVRALCRRRHRGRCTAAAGGRDRSKLERRLLDHRAVSGHRADHGAGDRAVRLWPQHRTLAGVGRCPRPCSGPGSGGRSGCCWQRR